MRRGLDKSPRLCYDEGAGIPLGITVVPRTFCIGVHVCQRKGWAAQTAADSPKGAPRKWCVFCFCPTGTCTPRLERRGGGVVDRHAVRHAPRCAATHTAATRAVLLLAAARHGWRASERSERGSAARSAARGQCGKGAPPAVGVAGVPPRAPSHPRAQRGLCVALHSIRGAERNKGCGRVPIT